jgi:hypothetical protein
MLSLAGFNTAPSVCTPESGAPASDQRDPGLPGG